MDFPPVLITSDVVAPLRNVNFSAQPMSENKTGKICMYVFIFTVVGICCFVLGMLLGKHKSKTKQKITLTTSRNKRFVYLKTNEDRYINTQEKIFPINSQNHTMMIHTSPDPVTVWQIDFQDDERLLFSLKTEIGGLVYSVQDGAPGTGAPWGIAYVGPVINPVGSDVVFKFLEDNTLVATSSTWPGGNYVFLGLSNEVICWTDKREEGLVITVTT